MNHIREKLKKNRPNLSESSLTTYGSTLTNLYFKVFPNEPRKDLDVAKFDETEPFMKYLADVEAAKRKSYLCALLNITGNQTYRLQMLKDQKTYDDEQKEQKMSKKERDNWPTQAEIKTIFDKMTKNVKLLLAKEGPLSGKEIQQWQSYVLFSIMTGLFVNPRRLVDWCEMKLRNIQEGDNYIETKGKGKRQTHTFVFNKYKTSEFHGKETVQIPAALWTILNKFIVANKDNDYLFFDSNGAKLTPAKLNQRINKEFGRNVSCNMLRHSFLTNTIGDIPAIKELQKLADSMGHTIGQALLYVKHDAPKG